MVLARGLSQILYHISSLTAEAQRRKRVSATARLIQSRREEAKALVSVLNVHEGESGYSSTSTNARLRATSTGPCKKCSISMLQ